MIDSERAIAETGILKTRDDTIGVGRFDIDESVLREDADASEDAVREFALAVDHAGDITRHDALRLADGEEESGHLSAARPFRFITSLKAVTFTRLVAVTPITPIATVVTIIPLTTVTPGTLV